MYCFCCTLDQKSAGLLSRRDFFKNLTNLTVQKLLTGITCTHNKHNIIMHWCGH